VRLFQAGFRRAAFGVAAFGVGAGFAGFRRGIRLGFRLVIHDGCGCGRWGCRVPCRCGQVGIQGCNIPIAQGSRRLAQQQSVQQVGVKRAGIRLVGGEHCTQRGQHIHRGAGSHLETCLGRHAVQAVGLLGAELAAGTFAVGEQFLSLICFLGCSPDIELSPHAGKPFCYVQLPSNDEPVVFQPIRKPARPLRCWVAIGNIYESEAIPDAALLQALETASGGAWKFAYTELPAGSATLR